VTWTCPSGFVTDAKQTASPYLVGCRPDALRCGLLPFATAPPDLPLLYVQEGAAAGGDGSESAPLADLAAALAVAATGTAVLVAAGTYPGPFVINRPLQIIGNCATQVKLVAHTGQAVVHVAGPTGGTLVLRDLQISGDVPGLRIRPGPHVVARRLWIRDCKDIGVWVRAGGSLALSDSVVMGGRKGAKGDGLGVGITSGSKASLVRVRASANREFGVYGLESGTFLQARELLVDGTRPGSSGAAVGVAALAAAKVTLHSVRVHDVVGSGLQTIGQASTLSATGALVNAGRAGLAPLKEGGTGPHGSGAMASAGGVLWLRGARLHHNAWVGLASHATNSMVDVQGLIVDATQPVKYDPSRQVPLATGHGYGLRITAGGAIQSKHVRLSANHTAGVYIDHLGSRWTADAIVIDGTSSDPFTGLHGLAAQIAGGAGVTLRRALLTGNRDYGLRIIGPDSTLRAEEILIQETETSLAGNNGVGLQVQDGSLAVLSAARLHRSTTAGVAAINSGSRLIVAGTLIDGTRPRPADGYAGNGLAVASGAHAAVSGANVVRNATSGAVVVSAGTQATVIGTRIAHNLASTDIAGNDALTEYLGVGLIITPKVTMVRLDACMVEHNRHAAVGCWHGSSLKIRRSVMQGTTASARGDVRRGAIKKTVADGVIGYNAKTVHIDQSLVLDVDRAGLHFEGSTDGRATRSLITGAVFGIVELDSAVVRDGLLLYNNETNSSSDAGLAVPAPPASVTDD